MELQDTEALFHNTVWAGTRHESVKTDAVML